MLPLLFAGICRAGGTPTALIITDGNVFDSEEANVAAYLRSDLQAVGYTVTTTAYSATLPSLTGYKQVWDIRYNDVGANDALTAADNTAYIAYLAGGGSVFLVGENPGIAALRDASIVTLVQSAGGGTLPTIVAASNTESVLPPFTTTPYALTSVVFLNAGGSSSHGTGSYINLDTSPADGIGTGILWAPGSLANAPAGTLVVEFSDVFMESSANLNSNELLANLIGYLGSPGPFITSLTPNSGPVGTSVVIAGGGFGATQSTSTAMFNGTVATSVTSWSASSITAKVPAGATTGNVVVDVGGLFSNGVPFTVTATPPLPPASVPTLSETALILLAGGLIGIGAWRLRRRYRASAV